MTGDDFIKFSSFNLSISLGSSSVLLLLCIDTGVHEHTQTHHRTSVSVA